MYVFISKSKKTPLYLFFTIIVSRWNVQKRKNDSLINESYF